MSFSQRMNIAGCGLLFAGALLGFALVSFPLYRGSKLSGERPALPADHLIVPVCSKPLPVEREQLGYELLVLLADDNVAGELGLDAQQRETIFGLGQQYIRVAARAAVEEQAIANAPHFAIDAAYAHLTPREALQVCGEAAVATLTPGQLERLDQVLFQLRSIDIYAEPKIRHAIQCTAAQLHGLTAIRQQAEVDMRELRHALRGRELARADYENRVHAGLVAAEEEFDRLLTSEQQGIVAGWRGERLRFGRMHLRLRIRSE